MPMMFNIFLESKWGERTIFKRKPKKHKSDDLPNKT